MRAVHSEAKRLYYATCGGGISHCLFGTLRVYKCLLRQWKIICNIYPKHHYFYLWCARSFWKETIAKRFMEGLCVRFLYSAFLNEKENKYCCFVRSITQKRLISCLKHLSLCVVVNNNETTCCELYILIRYLLHFVYISSVTPCMMWIFWSVIICRRWFWMMMSAARMCARWNV